MKHIPKVTVEESDPALPYQQKIVSDRHFWFADEPKDVNGGDTGPTPIEYMLGALGACTTMTLRMYINRKEWKVNRLAVIVEHATKEDGKTKFMERRLTIEGELDEDQRARLLEIANKCPVHKMLEHSQEIVTKYA